MLDTVRRELGSTAVILDRDPGDITTIEDEGSEGELQAWTHMKEVSVAQASTRSVAV